MVTELRRSMLLYVSSHLCVTGCSSGRANRTHRIRHFSIAHCQLRRLARLCLSALLLAGRRNVSGCVWLGVACSQLHSRPAPGPRLSLSASRRLSACSRLSIGSISRALLLARSSPTHACCAVNYTNGSQDPSADFSRHSLRKSAQVVTLLAFACTAQAGQRFRLITY